METKGQTAVAHKLAEVEPGTLRHRVLSTAQKFKSSWVELGALLVKVQRGSVFKEWGFASFEEYCAKELRIKRQTAEKLTRSYGFLAHHERGLVERREKEPESAASQVPAFEVVSVLAGAEDRGQLSDKDYQSLREQIWADDRPTAAVARDLSQKFPVPPRPPPPPDLVLRRLAQAARRLASDLRACRQVPAAVSERAAALAEDVEELASGS